MRQLGIEGTSDCTYANVKNAPGPRYMIEAATSGAVVLLTLSGCNQVTEVAKGEWDYGTCHEPTVRTTTQPPERRRAARRRRKGPGPTAARTP